MSAKKDPASVVVTFFETASPETAQTVLAICKGILQRRIGPAKAKRAGKQAQTGPVRDMALEQK